MKDAHPPKPGLSFAVGVIGHRPNRLPDGAGAWLNTQTGAVLLTDFMPLRGSNSDIIRRITGQHGQVIMCS